MFTKHQVDATKRKKIYFETLSCIAIFIISFIGLHYLMTYFFGFTSKDSFSILAPTFLICFLAALFGYHVGFKKYYSQNASMKDAPILNNQIEKRHKRVIPIILYTIATMAFTFSGLYFLIFEKSYSIGLILAGVGAFISILLTKTLLTSEQTGTGTDK